MALHYHGLPLTPTKNLELINGKNVCISHATAYKGCIEWALKHAQSIMWDNGAFSFYNKGGKINIPSFYSWLEDKLGHPHWAVIPDVIGGTEEQQKELLLTWPYPKEYGAPVWHLGLSFDYLLYLVDNYPKVCLGSSDKYWKVGGKEWSNRMDETFNYLVSKRRYLPWLHGLRMLNQLKNKWPLASADSVNVARNYKTRGVCPGCMANQIDKHNPPLFWQITEHKQLNLIEDFE
jgi:hypothetical protein